MSIEQPFVHDLAVTLAALGPRIAEARAAAVQSLGKHAALEKLADRADQDAAQIRAARAERDAPQPAARRIE